MTPLFPGTEGLGGIADTMRVAFNNRPTAAYTSVYGCFLVCSNLWVLEYKLRMQTGSDIKAFQDLFPALFYQ